MNMESSEYPVTIRGDLTDPPGPGLWLIKWLLALPHFIVIFFLLIAFVGVWVIAFFAFFMGGGEIGGLVSVLTLFAAIVLLFTGKYPKDLFRLVVGMNRWSLRTVAYVGLMTDEYPPFRLSDGDE